MPTTLHRWRWYITDPASGRRSATTYRMTEADALATDPLAVRVEGSLEVLTVPDDPLALSAAGVQQGPGTVLREVPLSSAARTSQPGKGSGG